MMMNDYAQTIKKKENWKRRAAARQTAAAAAAAAAAAVKHETCCNITTQTQTSLRNESPRRETYVARQPSRGSAATRGKKKNGGNKPSPLLRGGRSRAMDESNTRASIQSVLVFFGRFAPRRAVRPGGRVHVHQSYSSIRSDIRLQSNHIRVFALRLKA